MKKDTKSVKEKNSINVEIIKEMNRELRSFLEHSLSTESFWDKWIAINFPIERIRCWEIKKCTHESCPSFLDVDCRCWLKVGTLCGGEVQGDFAKKLRTCFDCEVLEQVEKDVLRALYENVNILIHHLKKRDEKIVATAIKDQLTGVFNRTYFNAFMEKTIAYANRHGGQLSFIMIDIDGFKGLNDAYGHQAGDVVLIEVAAMLQGILRRSDSLFRYGGDEFLIVLQHANCEGIKVVKERIKQLVDVWNRENRRYNNFRLSLSFGCSTWNLGDDLLTTIKEADAMMYREKRQTKGAAQA